jgi:hypothetical protein
MASKNPITCPHCGSMNMHLSERAEGGINAYCRRCGTLARECAPSFCERCGKKIAAELLDRHHLCAQCQIVPQPVACNRFRT